MDVSYTSSSPKSKNLLGLVLIILAVIVLVGGVVWTVFARQKIISPVPPQASFEVIFYTPTPGQASPTASPSATPKVKKTVTATTAPKPTNTPKPTANLTEAAKVTATPTKVALTITATPTKETTATPTATKTP